MSEEKNLEEFKLNEEEIDKVVGGELEPGDPRRQCPICNCLIEGSKYIKHRVACKEAHPSYRSS